MGTCTWATLAVLCSALTCSGTFLFAPYRQLALVEVAASVTLGIELYLLSATVRDWIEHEEAPDLGEEVALFTTGSKSKSAG